MRELGWQSHCHVFGQRQCKDIQKEGASLYSESEGMTGDLKYKVRGVLVNLPRLWTGALINKERVAESLTRLWSETMQKGGDG